MITARSTASTGGGARDRASVAPPLTVLRRGEQVLRVGDSLTAEAAISFSQIASGAKVG